MKVSSTIVIPTRDYLFSLSFDDICQAVDFIHVKSGKTTYVHCKVGRGRSTTIVRCYLVEHKGMSHVDAYTYVRSKKIKGSSSFFPVAGSAGVH